MRAFGLGIRTSGRILIRNENGSQYFAVKVFSIQASVDIGQQELKRHAIMMSNASNHPGSRHVAINCWSVVLAEPFSRLVCVMDLCGTCLTQLYLTGGQGTKGHWRIHVWRKLFRDMLLALDFLHSECGLVHGGTSHTFYPQSRVNKVRVPRIINKAACQASLGQTVIRSFE
ncbi:hypothetical protein EV421DRAFT_1783474 [Armillaria borealis]|uniref:Protein kinase domain-containing protein n=1 Tax=Armillaria borealis TaxID=47425 RepID=A0AA39MWP7_9AGAR|nr:hypothetical protein EV421DRAFT_1783474 [Armillaria borealis]